jgi:hypothetical protein
MAAPIEPPEIQPPTPGNPTEPPPKEPPGNPRPELPPPVCEPGEPAPLDNLPVRTPDEFPIREPNKPTTPNPAVSQIKARKGQGERGVKLSGLRGYGREAKAADIARAKALASRAANNAGSAISASRMMRASWISL